MEVKDVFLGPLYLIFIYLAAYAVRGRFSNSFTRQYFIKAFTAKIVGAIALGLIYQFYYGGGDTFNYFRHASLINAAFDVSFSTGWKLIMSSGGDFYPDTIKFTSQMYWYQAGSAEYLLSRLAAVLGLLCFNSYVVISLFFACLSFSGVWAMYLTFIKIRPEAYKELAIGVLFIPSVFFWGSGLMKDSITLGALGWVFYFFYKGGIQRRDVTRCLIFGVFSAYVLVKIKVYILLCFLPAALLWLFNENSTRIKNVVLRGALKPLFIIFGLGAAFYAGTNLTKGDEEYDVDKIGARTKKVSDYLYETSIKQNGSAYKLGEQDGTLTGMAKLAPQAIIVSLYRPFLWEVRNPVMLMSALEALFFLLFTIRILYRSGVGKTLRLVAATPSLTLCFLFSFAFSATVGVVSNNFGTLVRYKIPMIPFFVAGLYITESMSVGQQAEKKKKHSDALRRQIHA